MSCLLKGKKIWHAPFEKRLAKILIELLEKVRRREGDSNSRSRKALVFETSAFDRSAISPAVTQEIGLKMPINPWAG